MTPQKFIVGRYTLGDETALWKLYVATTHNVVSRDYTPAQCQRWAPADKDMAEWWLQVQSRNPFVVRTNGGILGFAELEETGHIDHFYVHHQWQGKGVGRALYKAVETEAVRLQLPLLFTESSVTAMPFFVRMGFDVMEEQAPIVCGAPAKQFLMRKHLTDSALVHGTTTPRLWRKQTMNFDVREIDEELASIAQAEFRNIGWEKPVGYFHECLVRHLADEIVTFVAMAELHYVGHVKLVWKPDYPYFRDSNIPEIQDLNVLPQFRNMGVGTKLIQCCEDRARLKSQMIGIGVGLHPGYNNAQRLYSRLGYVIDGNGVHYEDIPIQMGKSYPFDDELVLYFTKQIAFQAGAS